MDNPLVLPFPKTLLSLSILIHELYHGIKSWQALADQRYAELITGCEDVRRDIDYVDGKFHERYFDTNGNEVFVTE